MTTQLLEKLQDHWIGSVMASEKEVQKIRAAALAKVLGDEYTLQEIDSRIGLNVRITGDTSRETKLQLDGETIVTVIRKFQPLEAEWEVHMTFTSSVGSLDLELGARICERLKNEMSEFLAKSPLA